MDVVVAEPAGESLPLHVVSSAELSAFLQTRSAAHAAYAVGVGFAADPGEVLALSRADGAPERVLLGAGKGDDPFVLGALPLKLAPRDYVIASAPLAWSWEDMALGWALGAYCFDRYKKPARAPARLVAPPGADLAELHRLTVSVTLVRDLVNTPARDMGPEALEGAARELAYAFGATAKVSVGDRLLQDNYPVVHAVGRAAAEAPRMIELEWGAKDAPRLALVGKGVCFDSGGLNIKTGDYMRLMKKDMGGAAHALALARLIMHARLPINLHVLIPAVENAIGAQAFRPGDILKTRAGQTVEVDNTDAEGRLILADALTRAVELNPELILDYATLTGAARVAIGPEIAAYYTNRDEQAHALDAGARLTRDPVWRLPLWPGYENQLDSPVADMKNFSPSPFAGSIVAALFLQRFVGGRPWIHFDVFAWNTNARPARPMGGEAQGLRAAWSMLKTRYRG